MAECSKPTKRKRKKFYGGGKKGKFEKKVIKAGMRGVLVFGAENEAKARREAYNLLNEYADELFGSELTEHISNKDVEISKDNKNPDETQQSNKLVIKYQHDDEESSTENEEDVDDIETAIAKEIKQIKSLKDSRRFLEIPTGVNAILFIRTMLSTDELNKLIHCILSDIAKTKQNKARSFQRLVPITNICSADLKSINKIVIENFLAREDTKGCDSICVHYKSRFNNILKRNDVLSEVSSVFLNSGHKVDLKNPDMVIVVEIIKGLCFMNILTDFFHFKKYNLHQIASAKENTTDTKNECKDTGQGTTEDSFQENSAKPDS